MEIYAPMPESFKPELLRRLALKELLLVIGQFGLVQVAERIGYTEFVEFFKTSKPAAIGGSNEQTAAKA
jgi:hypothetical protein